MNKQVLLAIPLLVLISLSVTGIAFAMWKDDVTFSGQITTTNICAVVTEAMTTDPCGKSLDRMDDPYTPTWRPWNLDKDIACTSITIVDDKTVSVFVDNAYPGYTVGLDIKVCNCGALHWNLTSIVVEVNGQIVHQVVDQQTSRFFLDLNDDGQNDIAVDHSGWQSIGDQIGEGCIDTSWSLVVLQPAPQGVTLTFNITYMVCQFNAIPEPPVLR